MKEVRLGVIGMGNMGTVHARGIGRGAVPGGRLSAVCDLNPERLSAFEAEQGVSLFTDAQAMMQSGLVDAVIIATPHYSHTPLGIAALGCGLHTLVEKPISAHKADCERLLAAHTDKKLVFAAMFNLRGYPRYRKLKALIDSGELGRINRINWIVTDWFRTEKYYTSGSWRATWQGEGGGVLLNQCPHQLDLWQWLFGMPASVRAFCTYGRFHPIEVEDDVTAYFEYDNGASGVFIATTGEAPGTNRLEIAAERGRLLVEPDGLQWRRNEVPASEWSATSEEGFKAPPFWDITIPASGNAEGHLTILKNFVAAILEGAPLIASAQEGIHSVELANAMLYSSDTGQTVTLPLDAKLYEASLMEKIARSAAGKSA